MILQITGYMLRTVALAAILCVFVQPSSATTFWIDADGTLIRATSDPSASPPSAVTSTEIAPESGRQKWNGTSWGPLPPAPKPPMDAEDVWEALKAKGLVTDADVPPDRRLPPRQP